MQRLAALLPRRSDWTTARREPGRNLVAGLTVALVALPLALGFGASSGLGADAGLVTAVVAGVLAAVFGGSNLQVSGPTGAMTVVLVPVVHEFGRDGALMVGLIAGIVLIVLAVGRIGRYARYIPMPVVEGFTAGIAVVIALQQVPAALGVEGPARERVWQTAFDAVRAFGDHPGVAPLAVTICVTALILGGSRWRPGLPLSVLAMAAATVLVRLAHLDVDLLGTLPSGLPGPSLGFFDLDAFRALLPSALAVAALAAIESLLSATVADGMSVSQRHNPDRELFGQGIANLAAPLFGGVAATGAIARTAVNVRAGASSRLSALTHAVVLAAVIYTVAPLVELIPLAALAGVLLATAIRMVEAASLLALARSTRGDAAVLGLTFVTTVVVDLVTAVAIGVGVAILLALRAVARSARLDEVPLDPGDHSEEERALLGEHIVAYRLDGPLFFAAAHTFLLELSTVTDMRVVILRMSRVTTLDATGAHVLGDAITQLERRGIVVLLSGIRPGHDEILTALGVAGELRNAGRIFADTPAAIEHARRLIHADAARPAGTSEPVPPANEDGLHPTTT